jgi:DNA-directed RNA polymerase subunit RPC12/RpoP
MTDEKASGAVDVWRPPPGFIAVPSAVPGVDVYAPAPEAPKVEQRTFKCPRCGATTTYSASEAALTCAYCGYTETPDAVVVGRRAAEAEFRVETLERTDRGWGQARREIHCESCGANLSLEPTDLATRCPFCGSNRIIAREETQASMLRPGFLIPFEIDRDSGARLLRDWLARGWMHPPELRDLGSSAGLSGVYLPFWTFSARVDTNWQAEVGHRRRRTTWDGKTKTEIKWKWKSGRFDLDIEDMLLPGTSKVSSLLLDRLYPFDLSDLTLYAPAYLAGWRAQAYDISLRPAWDEARGTMRERAKEAAYEEINSNHVRNFGMTADLEKERWRYVLLPVYVAGYRFRGKAYQVLISGQTGAVAGQKPVSWWRVAAALALLLVPAVVLILVAGVLPVNWRNVSMFVGWGALIVGLLLGALILQQALAADDA